MMDLAVFAKANEIARRVLDPHSGMAPLSFADENTLARAYTEARAELDAANRQRHHPACDETGGE